MASVDPSELLAHAAWLRGLARTLVREDADDLVQDTWVAALRRPPDGASNVRPWLRTVLTNVARLRWRGDTHRTAREQVAATRGDDEAPSSEQLLERHELQQALARFVGELDEPYRSTILLRFAEGLTPTQIARRLAIPASTVRWRLKEALARLRAQLDACHRGDRRAWLAALVPLSIPAPRPVSPVIAFAVVASVACVVAIASLAGDRSPPAQPLAEPRAASVIPRAPTAVAPPTLAWLAQEGAPRRGLTGRVLFGGAPAAGARVRLGADPLPARDVVADQDGRFDFGEQVPREYVVGASLPDKLAAIRRVDLRDPQTATDIELVLGDCVAKLYGKVTDASGTPIAHAELLREGVIGDETDAAGNYEVCVLPTAALVAEIRLVVRADGFGTLAVTIAPSGHLRRDIVLAPEAVLGGRVVDAEGAPIANARVAIDLTGAEASMPPERGFSITVVSDNDGRFRLAGLATGEYRVAASSADAVVSPVSVSVVAAETREIELRASSTGIVRGRVLVQGRPIAGVTIAAGTEIAVSQADGSYVLARMPVGDLELATTPYKRTSGAIHVVAGDRNTADITVEAMGTMRGTVRRRGVPVPFARVNLRGPSRAGVSTNAAGRYEVRGLEAGTYGLYADDRRLGAISAIDNAVELGAGETREYDVELTWGGRIAGRVIDAHGAPVPAVEVRFVGQIASKCMTDEAGTFTCGGLGGGAYRAAVFPASGAVHPFGFVAAPPKLELRDGDARVDGVRLVVRPTLLAIDGKVVDGQGAPVPDVEVRAFGADRKRVVTFRPIPETITDGDGRFRIPDLSPGDYHVEVRTAGDAARQTIAAGTSTVALVVDKPACDGARGHELPPRFTRPPGQVVWNQQIELVGWSLPTAAKLDMPFELTLVYRSLQPVQTDWKIFAHFDSQTWRVNADHDPAIGWCPASQWQPGETIVDRAMVRIDRAGRYALTIGLFTGRAPSWENLPVSAIPSAMKKTPRHGVHVGEIVVE